MINLSDDLTQYGVEGKDQFIVKSVIENKISDTSPFKIYVMRADNTTFIENTNNTSCSDDECRKTLLDSYLGFYGACSGSTTLITDVIVPSTCKVASSGNTTATQAYHRDFYKFYYNPDTTSNYSSSSLYGCVSGGSCKAN